MTEPSGLSPDFLTACFPLKPRSPIFEPMFPSGTLGSSTSATTIFNTCLSRLSTTYLLAASLVLKPFTTLPSLSTTLNLTGAGFPSITFFTEFAMSRVMSSLNFISFSFYIGLLKKVILNKYPSNG